VYVGNFSRLFTPNLVIGRKGCGDVVGDVYSVTIVFSVTASVGVTVIGVRIVGAGRSVAAIRGGCIWVSSCMVSSLCFLRFLLLRISVVSWCSNVDLLSSVSD
jgi:hypothetical protein